MRTGSIALGLGLLLHLACSDSGAEPETQGCVRDSFATLDRALRGETPPATRQVRRALAEAACREEVPPLLLAALAFQESRFDPRARGPAGGRGLLQVRPATAEEIARLAGLAFSGADSLFEPRLNARLGAAYLRHLQEEFESWEAVLSAYNLGPTRLRGMLRKGRRATSPYARKVQERWRSWEASVGGRP